MTYTVKFEEHHHYVLTFDRKEEFEDWEATGFCVSDLAPRVIESCKTYISTDTPEDDE